MSQRFEHAVAPLHWTQLLPSMPVVRLLVALLLTRYERVMETLGDSPFLAGGLEHPELRSDRLLMSIRQCFEHAGNMEQFEDLTHPSGLSLQ